MAVLGGIIKSFLELRDVVASEPNPIEEQQAVLEMLLNKAKDTAFGKYYGFERLLHMDNIPSEYARKIPYHDYNEISER